MPGLGHDTGQMPAHFRFRGGGVHHQHTGAIAFHDPARAGNHRVDVLGFGQGQDHLVGGGAQRGDTVGVGRAQRRRHLPARRVEVETDHLETFTQQCLGHAETHLTQSNHPNNRHPAPLTSSNFGRYCFANRRSAQAVKPGPSKNAWIRAISASLVKPGQWPTPAKA